MLTEPTNETPRRKRTTTVTHEEDKRMALVQRLIEALVDEHPELLDEVLEALN